MVHGSGYCTFSFMTFRLSYISDFQSERHGQLRIHALKAWCMDVVTRLRSLEAHWIQQMASRNPHGGNDPDELA